MHTAVRQDALGLLMPVLAICFLIIKGAHRRCYEAAAWPCFTLLICTTPQGMQTLLAWQPTDAKSWPIRTACY